MAKTSISTQKLAYTLIILVLSMHIIIIGKPILVPLSFALLITLLLTPLCHRIEKKIHSRIIAVIIAFLVAVLPPGALIFVFSLQFAKIIGDLASLREEVAKGILDQISLAAQQLGISISDWREWGIDNLTGIVNAPISFLMEGIGTSTYILTSIVLTIIFSFLFLLYRNSAKQFITIQFDLKSRSNALSTMNRIQKLTQGYLYGILIVMIILAICNSLGLFLIGIEYAVFWGCLAAFMALIPYIGTTLGGLFPFLFALATCGNFWQPAAVVIMFSSIQFIEGNFITPKIVGNSVSINPLVAIIALILGGMIWGISGMILAIPLFGVFNVILFNIDPLKPVSLLFGNKLHSRENEFTEKYDKPRYRLMRLFRKDKES